MIMEYAEGGELFDYIIKKDHLSEEESRKIFHQLIDAIDYMHQMGICHRDLKPENILFDASYKNIKIIDFGLSNLYYTYSNIDDDNINKILNDDLDVDLLETPCGSPGYAPPEMVLGFSYNGLLTDIWSSGIILFAMLCGSFPFDDDSEQVLYTKIVKGEFDFPSDINLSKEAKNLVKKILVVNPSYRANITDIKSDPWFQKDYKPTYGLFLPIQEIPIDNSIISEMLKMGYKNEEIRKNVKNNRHNEITTLYYLLVKKYNRKGIDSVSDLISSCFTKYILEQNKKIKDLKNYKILINLKLIFEKIKIEEAENIVKVFEKNITKEKESIKEIQKNKEKDKKEDIKAENNKNEKYNNYSLEIRQNLENNNHKFITNFSHKKEENSRNLNKSNAYKIKDNQIKNFKNLKLASLHKNKKFKKMIKTIDKKDKNKNNIQKFKLNSISLEKSSHFNNKKGLKASLNIKKDSIFNLSIPYQENDKRNTITFSSKREKNYINQGMNSSRINTDRINYEKYFSIKPNIKVVIKKGNIPLFQKFKLNCNENKKASIKTRLKVNKGFINKIVKNSKNSAFNIYSLNKKLNLNSKNKNNNTHHSFKNITSKNEIIKNVSLQNEKGNMSYRQTQKNKILFENNLSRILTASGGKSNSLSKVKAKLHISTHYNTSGRNKYLKKGKIKKIKNKAEILENNQLHKKAKNSYIDNKEETKKEELKQNSYKSKENNINFSININLNLNQIKNTLKEREKTTPIEQAKKKSLKSIKLDLKKINNNYQMFNENSSINSERIHYENIFKTKQNFIFSKKKDFINNTKSLINPINNIIYNKKNNSHSKEEYKNKKINYKTYNQEFNQKPFVNQKTKIITNCLTKLLPFLKSMKRFKTSSRKKPSPNINKKIIALNDSNSILINKTNTKINPNIFYNNNKYKINLKIEQIKKKRKLINKNFYKNATNDSDINEIPISKYNTKKNSLKINPLNLKGIINGNKNSFICKSSTMRGGQAKNKILNSMKELSKSGNNSKEINYKDEKNSINKINKVNPNTITINKDAIFEKNPLKIKDILLTQLSRYNISIKQKSSKDNYFVFHCLKGLIKIIIELSKIKGNNYIFVQIKCISGNQKEFDKIRRQILGIIRVHL